MKKILLTAMVCISMGFAAGWFLFHRQNQPVLKETTRKVLYYQNPMSPEMTSPTPKKAPDGMDYVPVYAEAEKPSGQRKIAYYQDPMHPWYTSDKPGKAPDCGMDLVPVYQEDNSAKGIYINPTTVQNIGVTTETISRRKLTKTIRTSAIVEFDETRLYSINTKFMGWVEKLYVDYTGRAVKKGEPLLDLYSPDIVSTQEEYLQALRYRERLQKSELVAARREADELVQSTRRRLEYWDITDREIASLTLRGKPRRALTIHSPANGIVTDKMVIDGQQVMPGMTLYKIADLTTVWVTADIYQYELDWIRLGQQVTLELSYLPEKAIQGTVTYIYPYLDTATRTAKVRIQVLNTPGFDLKPGMFATVKIVSLVSIDDIAVPEQAVIRSGERNVVVISLGGGYFDPRNVRLGATADGYVQILEGVHEGEKVVTSAQFLIDSESNLKASIAGMNQPEKTDKQPEIDQKQVDEFFEDFEPKPATKPAKEEHKTDGMEMK
ncbi:MAG: efflux RND transporter periplasmic adaptor subunit [Proteobacteria bacterium]|nr:efflux RND transporter periplasmic adaptor subunit [Pseudomonadota bacterium]MBU4472435.1 efflux RND transporter periplasmic adaptor subunit [Pseudomonadota bacterium]MCG2751262.1 efflux RND transporter periplasmic adaptor subunit [Desulfobacteraceae bacterium]